MQFPHIQGLLSEDLKILIAEAKSVLVSRAPITKAKRYLKRNSNSANIAQEKNCEIIAFNSSYPLSPVHHLAKKKLNAAAMYLPALMAQDWSHLFKSESFSDDRKFYVYAHVNPILPNLNAPDSCGGIYNGQPFYIGKGTGDRAYDLKRNQGHGKELQKLLNRGYGKENIVKIIFTGLTEAEAYEAESKLIYFFGTIYGSSKGILFNLDTPKLPKFCGVMKKMDFSHHSIKEE